MKTKVSKSKTLFIAAGITLLAFTGNPLHAQFAAAEKTEKTMPASYRKNNVKINLSSLALKNYSLYYERSLTRKISFSGGWRNMPASNVGELPAVKFLSEKFDEDELINGINIMNASANAYTGEFRFYGGKKPGARGFYLSLYGRYTDMKIGYDYTYEANDYDPVTYEYTGTRSYNIPIKSNIKGFGGGLMIGAQWLIAKRVTFDWYILGGHYGKLKGDANGFADMSSMNDYEKAYMKSDIESTGIGNSITATVTNDGIIAKASGPFIGLRGAGFSLGIAF